MRAVTTAVAVTFLATIACGGAPADSPATSGGASTPPSALTSAETLSRCAELTPAKAAALLGVAPTEVTDYSRTEGKLRMCVFRKPDERSKTLSFTLSHSESVEKAAASMRRERESMGSAQSAIDRATGTQSKSAATEDVSAIGDEAFYSPMNGAIMLRVGNVIAQVMAPQDMALKKRAAEEVAQGLRR